MRAEWEKNSRDKGFLLREAPLAVAEQWLKDRPADLSDSEREFIQESIGLRQSEHRKRARRLRLAVGAAVMFFLVAGIAGVFWRISHSNAEEASQNAEAAAANLYVARISSVGGLLESGIVSPAVEILKRCEQPTPGGKDLRGWEWYYLRRLCQPELHPLIAKEGQVVSVAIDPDSRWLAAGGMHGSLGIWDIATGELLRRIDGHKDRVLSLAFSPDGKWLASGGFDQTARVWDTTGGLTLQTLDGPKDRVHNVAFSLDGRWLAASSGETLCVWRSPTWKLLHTLKGKQRHFWGCVAFSLDGELLAAADNRKDVILWNPTTGALNVRSLDPKVRSRPWPSTTTASG
jgi:WD40 repeat protein